MRSTAMQSTFHPLLVLLLLGSCADPHRLLLLPHLFLRLVFPLKHHHHHHELELHELVELACSREDHSKGQSIWQKLLMRNSVLPGQ
ncbi:unnamed protein product [Boreogadus saida]